LECEARRNATVTTNILPVHTWEVLDSGREPDRYTSADRYNVAGGNLNRLVTFIVRAKQLNASYVHDGDRNTQDVDQVLHVLRMHVPPDEIVFNYSQEIMRSKVRGGWKVERWGETLTTVEVSGSTGAFMHSIDGATRKNAADTYAYTDFMRLVQMYRNNGMSYDPKMGVVDTIGEVIFAYDRNVYRGSFDAFDIKESEESPFRFRYSFVFVIRGQYNSVNSTVTGHSDNYTKEETDSLIKTIQFGNQPALFSGQVDFALSRITSLVGQTGEYRKKITADIQRQKRKWSVGVSPLDLGGEIPKVTSSIDAFSERMRLTTSLGKENTMLYHPDVYKTKNPHGKGSQRVVDGTFLGLPIKDALEDARDSSSNARTRRNE
jgi:hypothetical protein